jgi:hypothetical protein
MPLGQDDQAPAVVIESNPFDLNNMIYSNAEEDYSADETLEPQDPLMGSGK